ncbi:MAG TPA: tetratricopeptide repeat protein [Myxococcales bacterium]|nr:tetratricopeptide repeat protein [Myxococcales bacterium]
MKRALLLVALGACAHGAQQPQRVEIISEPTVITAGPPELVPLGEMDDATLFDAGTRAFQGGEFEKAAQYFDRLWESFPESPNRVPALWNAALSEERLGRSGEALQRFDEYIKFKDEPEAQLHAALAEHELRRLDDAAARLHKLAERPGLALLTKASALMQEGVCRIEGGARADGEVVLRQALEIYEDVAHEEPVDPSLPAQAEFWLGEAYRGSFHAVRLDPSAMDEKALGDALETKAEFLLSAQGHYLRCIRRGDGEWATAAGFRIGELYEALHDELLGAPLPPGLTDEQRALYQSELRKKVRDLVQKAIRVYEETLSVAQRTGASSAYVQKTQAALDRMRALLLGND